MRACWWLLVTAHLVWGNQEQRQFHSAYENSIKPDADEDGLAEEEHHLNTIYDPKTVHTRRRRSLLEDDRDKKQQKFHAWGGKRYEYEDGDDSEENIAPEEHTNTNESDEDGSPGGDPFFPSNETDSQAETSDEDFRKAFQKRGKQTPAFSSWAGKRDPETVNDLAKRADVFRYQEDTLGSGGSEQSRKRYPSFNSWAGKRGTNYGGKRADSQKTNNLLPFLRADFFSSIEHSDSDDIHNHDHSYLDVPEVEVFNSKRAASFNNWGSKIKPTFNRWTGKRQAAFNSWGGKRAAAFNSWGGKRAAAFNSWGGKRAATFNSWGGKRAAAFNSWGGKRTAAFNSWGGKRAAAFNSWGGKRAAAFNSWGGKRAAAFNSWGGKRAAAFNSWGGKRDSPSNHWYSKQELGNLDSQHTSKLPAWIENGVKFSSPSVKSYLYGPNNQKIFFLGNTDDLLPEQKYSDKQTSDMKVDGQNDINSSTLKNSDETYNNNILTDDEESNNLKERDSELLQQDSSYPLSLKYTDKWKKENLIEKREKPSFSSWAGKRSPLFSSWYESKMPAVQLSSGKRRPAFSSWGGKRSERVETYQGSPEKCSPLHSANEENPGYAEHERNSQPPEEKTYLRRKREAICANDCMEKKSGENEKKNRVFTRMLLQGSLTWPMAFRSQPRNMDFYAWGGKRSL